MIEDYAEEIVNETIRASNLFGDFRGKHEAIAVIREEYLELEHEIFHGDLINAREEAVQLGAMALKLIDYIEKLND